MPLEPVGSHAEAREPPRPRHGLNGGRGHDEGAEAGRPELADDRPGESLVGEVARDDPAAVTDSQGNVVFVSPSAFARTFATSAVRVVRTMGSSRRTWKPAFVLAMEPPVKRAQA